MAMDQTEASLSGSAQTPAHNYQAYLRFANLDGNFWFGMCIRRLNGATLIPNVNPQLRSSITVPVHDTGDAV